MYFLYGILIMDVLIVFKSYFRIVYFVYFVCGYFYIWYKFYVDLGV